jgi:hypothetical protein
LKYIDNIQNFPSYIKKFIFFFILALSFGYFTGFSFIYNTTHLNPQGLEENYNGNEADETANVMLFKKSEREILSIVHSHVISFSLIFLSLGILVISVPMHPILKSFLLVEPFISTILTFGGIWLLWKEIVWFKYIVMISGTLLTISYLTSVIFIFNHLCKKTN